MSAIKLALEPWMVGWLRDGDWEDLPNEILAPLSDRWLVPEDVIPVANEVIAKAIEALL